MIAFYFTNPYTIYSKQKPGLENNVSMGLSHHPLGGGCYAWIGKVPPKPTKTPSPAHKSKKNPLFYASLHT